MRPVKVVLDIVITSHCRETLGPIVEDFKNHRLPGSALEHASDPPAAERAGGRTLKYPYFYEADSCKARLSWLQCSQRTYH